MTSEATKKFVGISRRKVARLGNEVKRKKVNMAKAQLSFLPQRAARELFKAIRSAEANFQVKNPNFNTDDLWVSRVLVDQGPSIRRMMPRARGSADVLKKRSCHIKVILSDS